MYPLFRLADIQVTTNDIPNVPKNSFDGNNIANILRIVFGIAGGVAVLLVAIAGFKYVMSQGDPQATAKAKNTIIDALIGLVICITAFSIVGFVVGHL